jgi:hypothetical protein
VWVQTCNCIYWTLKLETTNNYGSLTELHTPKIAITTTHKVFSVFTSRCLLAASNGRRSSSSGFPNRPWPQLTAPHFTQLQLSADSITDPRVRVTLLLVVYRQLVHLGGHSPYVASSLTRRRVRLLRTLFAFVKCTYRTHSMLLRILPFALRIQVLCQYRLCKEDHAYLTYLMLQRQLSHLNGRKLDHS